VSRRVLTISFETPSCALVRGYGSRELLTELRGGRPPVWATRSRAWVTQPATARDLIAVAETRGYDIVITGETEAEARETARLLGVGDRSDESGLW
jgi:hypothetical protein